MITMSSTENTNFSSFSIDNFELELLEYERIQLELENQSSTFHEHDSLNENFQRDRELISKCRAILSVTHRMSTAEEVIVTRGMQLIRACRRYKIVY